MTLAKVRGTRGEQLAKQYLQKQGLKYIASNWSCKVGEVDIIMHDPADDTRVFVEVRLRAPTQFGQGFETVARQKQTKLIRAAQYYQLKEDYWGHLRFDVISIIDVPNSSPEIEYIKDAFTL